MKEYVSPDVELIEFEKEIIMGSSGCNCFTDVWGNETVGQSNCKGGSWDASELMTNAPDWK